MLAYRFSREGFSVAEEGSMWLLTEVLGIEVDVGERGEVGLSLLKLESAGLG
jgi:hypothetical protein